MLTNLTFLTISKVTEYKGVLHCEGYDYEEDPENLLECPFFTRRMKLYGIDFHTTSELLYPNGKIRIRLIQAWPKLNMISEDPNVSLGFVDCFLYTRRLMLKEDYQRKGMSQLAYAPFEYDYMETLAKTYMIPARQNQVIQENNFNNPPIRRISIAMIWSSAFTGSLQRTHSGINILIRETLEYPEEHFHLYTTIRQIIVAVYPVCHNNENIELSRRYSFHSSW